MNEKDSGSANSLFVYKIRNKETGEWASGVNDYWSNSFLHTTIYDSPAPAKAVLTKLRKEAEWYKKQSYMKEERLNKYYEYLDKAEIVMVKLTMEVQS